jgi:sulfate permease, SulP family
LRELRLDVTASAYEGILELNPEGVLWFGTAHLLEDPFLELVAAHPHAKRLEIRLDTLGRVDLTGALAPRSLVEDARRAGLDVSIHGTPAHARRIVGRTLGSDVLVGATTVKEKRSESGGT